MKTVLSQIWKRKWIALIVALLIGGGVYYWQTVVANDKDEVVTENPQVQSVSQTLDVTGDVDAYERADLTFAAGGRLAWVGVKEGDWVRQWQSIASLDTRTLQKQLQQDLNTFNVKYREWEQVKDDNNAWDSATDIDKELRRILESADYNLQNSVINVEIRDLAIRLSSLISPINGMVTHLDKPHAGANVGLTDVFQIVNPSTVYFGAVVDEVDIAQVREGQSATIILDAYPDEVITSTITRVEFIPSTSRSGGTGYLVHLTMPASNDSLRYKMGMSGSAEILLSEKTDVMTVPTDSLITRDGQTYVEVLVEDSVEERLVEVGVETDELAEIVSGLSEADQVVVPQQEI